MMLNMPGSYQATGLGAGALWSITVPWSSPPNMASFKHMLCNDRGSNVSILEGLTMFLQVHVQLPPSRSG